MEIRTEEITAPAKVNIYLKIVGKRPDGYHELETLFHPFPALNDKLTISPADREFSLNCPGFDLPVEQNLVWKAWDRYASATGFRPGLSVELQKNIPTGAGLGGGSSDAAMILRYLQNRPDSPGMPAAELNALAASLGADVPFFLLDGPAWATGIGEKLDPCEVDLAGMTAVLACPDVHVNTAWAYKKWSELMAEKKDRIESGFCLTTSPGAYKKTAFKTRAVLYNDFETVVFPEFPYLREVKEMILNCGASGAVMSGSGASIFSLFRDSDKALKASEKLDAESIPNVICHF
jgi:4-diphosphocytidyl-2-C-methyl-D-erythritol kinase